MTDEPRLSARMLSPELVLVDEELAAWARLRLREDMVAAEVEGKNRPEFPKAPLLGAARRQVDSGANTEAGRRRAARRVPSAAYVVALIALLAALAAYVRASTRSPLHRESVVGGVSAMDETAAVDAQSPGLVFAWPSVRAARFYTFTLSRRSTAIFRARTEDRHRLVLPPTWVYGGRRFTLSRGLYRWRVLAYIGPPSRSVPRTVVAAPLVVKPRR